VLYDYAATRRSGAMGRVNVTFDSVGPSVLSLTFGWRFAIQHDKGLSFEIGPATEGNAVVPTGRISYGWW